MTYSQREIDGYYSLRTPCPGCGANWRCEGDAYTITHSPTCDFIGPEEDVDDELF